MKKEYKDNKGKKGMISNSEMKKKDKMSLMKTWAIKMKIWVSQKSS